MVEELQRFGPFRALSADGKALLGQGTVAHRWMRPTAVLHKGQPVSGAFIVLEGRLRVFTIAPNGTEATLYFIAPGETCVIALNCLFNDLLYPAWVEAERATSAAVVPGAVYRRLFETETSIRDLTVQALSTLVYRLMTELETVHGSQYRQRLAQFVLAHANADGVLAATQEEIAGHLGTSREVVARLVRDLVKQQIVETGRGRLRIRDLFALRAVVSSSWRR